MKKIALFVICIFVLSTSFVYAYISPGKSVGYVNDFAHILSTDNIAQIEERLSGLSSDTGDQVKVVTIQSLGGETIEKYAVKLFEEWKIGDKEKDNGVLFLIAPTERKVRIEVGYGLEEILTDAQSNRIIQDIVLPRFKEGKLPEGILDGVDSMESVLSGNSTIVSEISADSNGLIYDESTEQTGSATGIFVIAGLIMLTFFAFALFLYILVKILRRFFPKYIGDGDGSSGSSSGGSSSGGSSSSSSSGSSSSGGSSGGGGASGSW